MSNDINSQEITRPVRVVSADDQGNNFPSESGSEPQAKQWTIPEWLIEFVQESESEIVEEPDPDFTEVDEPAGIALPVSPEDSEWQPVQVEQELKTEALSRKQDFNFSDLEALLNNKDYAQLCNYLKDFHSKLKKSNASRKITLPPFLRRKFFLFVGALRELKIDSFDIGGSMERTLVLVKPDGVQRGSSEKLLPALKIAACVLSQLNS